MAITVTAGATSVSAQESCARVVHPIAAGAFAALSDFEPAACPASPLPRSFVYDAAARLLRTNRLLAAGEVVTSPPAFGFSAIRPGDRVKLVSEVGLVRVEHEVEAVSAARSGEPLFVKDARGTVFRVTFAAVPR